MDFHKLRNDLRRNGYNVGYIDLSTSKILMELFNDLRTVMAVVGTKDVELPIKQKVLELKTLHQSKTEQIANYQTMIDEENRKQKFKLDQTVDKLYEALKRVKNFSDLIADLEGDFEQLELYRNETGHKFSQYDNCDTQKLIKSQQNVIDDLKGIQITDFVPKTNYDELKTELNQLEIELASFRKRIDDKNAKLLQNDKEIASNKEKIESYQKSIDTLKTDYEKKCLKLNNELKINESAKIDLEVYIDDVLEEFRMFRQKVFSQLCDVCLKRLRPGHKTSK